MSFGSVAVADTKQSPVLLTDTQMENIVAGKNGVNGSMNHYVDEAGWKPDVGDAYNDSQRGESINGNENRLHANNSRGTCFNC
jgi:hypothetical protein